jgi:aspartate kinase
MTQSQNVKVCKFGGSSVADANQLKKIENILSLDETRRIVVVSAPGKRNPEETKITDLLYKVYRLASEKLDFSVPFQLIQERFEGIATELNIDYDVKSELEEISNTLKSSPENVTVDYVVSRGEYLSARLVSVFLGAEFIDGVDLIEIDHYYRIAESTYETISNKIDPNKKYVVPGFYGRDKKGAVKTFSRGGSDITGAIIAQGIKASVYENWTDVSGLLMADPRIVDNPLPMEHVSYREIRELSYSGANVFHDEAISPCKLVGLPINIRNTNRPEDPGTIIGEPLDDHPHTITGIAGRKGFSMIYIEKNMMNKERGFGRKVLGILEQHDISYEHSPTAIDSMSIVVDSEAFNNVEEQVLEDIQIQMNPDKITISDDLALIAVVGHGMVHEIGVAATLFTGLANESINIQVIDQGSSEINIIVGVHHDDYENSIRAIYNSFLK